MWDNMPSVHRLDTCQICNFYMSIKLEFINIDQYDGLYKSHDIHITKYTLYTFSIAVTRLLTFRSVYSNIYRDARLLISIRIYSPGYYHYVRSRR